jgi:hypothetical protein
VSKSEPAEGGAQYTKVKSAKCSVGSCWALVITLNVSI